MHIHDADEDVDDDPEHASDVDDDASRWKHTRQGIHQDADDEQDGRDRARHPR